ncbi:unannotated protein [freshwater metagenome]|uniref:Unannotated protein n=1 Tax=freshwater metagenome TaxID=449393 RepID=A0A6J7H4P5_9ZZZZ
MPTQEIANGIALVYKDVYGRGPTKIVAMILPDAVFVVLEEVNTPGQDHLVRIGELEMLTAVHDRMQRSIETELCAVVERVTGREVRSYVPGFNGRDGTAIDGFLLEPESRT